MQGACYFHAAAEHIALAVCLSHGSRYHKTIRARCFSAGVLPTQFDVAPSDPTGFTTAVFVYSGCAMYDTWCTVACALNGSPLPSASCYSPVSLPVVAVGTNRFVVNVTSTAAAHTAAAATLTWTWRVDSMFVDLVSAQSSGGGTAGPLIVPLQTGPGGVDPVTGVASAPNSANFTAHLPLPVGSNETVVVACVVDVGADVVSLSPTAVAYNRSTLPPPPFTITALPSYNNNVSDARARPYHVTCTVSSMDSSGSSGGAVTNGTTVYFAAGTHGVGGTVVDCVYPLWQDLLVLDHSGKWQSAVTVLSGGAVNLAATLYADDVVALVGDASYRGRGAVPNFDVASGTSVWIGGLAATVLAGPPAGSVDLRTSYRNVTDVLYFRAPPYGVECPTNASCVGYKTITVVNPVVMARQPRLVTGGAVSCPPTCPGNVDAAVGSSGVYYAAGCPGYLNGSQCLDPAVTSRCAFGPPGQCQRCPDGCICPGGARCWCVTL